MKKLFLKFVDLFDKKWQMFFVLSLSVVWFTAVIDWLKFPSQFTTAGMITAIALGFMTLVHGVENK